MVVTKACREKVTGVKSEAFVSGLAGFRVRIQKSLHNRVSILQPEDLANHSHRTVLPTVNQVHLCREQLLVYLVFGVGVNMYCHQMISFVAHS